VEFVCPRALVTLTSAQGAGGGVTVDKILPTALRFYMMQVIVRQPNQRCNPAANSSGR